MTDSIHIAIKEVMDRGDIFTVQDIVDHIHRKLPGYTYRNGQSLFSFTIFDYCR